MVENLLDFISLLGNWGYLVIFLASFLESAALLGFVLPGETIVIIAGILSSQGYLDLEKSLIVVALGAPLGDSTGFWIGRIIGRDYFRKHGRLLLLKEKHLDRVNLYFQEHGGKTIFFGRFIGFLRHLAPITAGMAGMHYGKFVRFNVPGGLLWSISFTLLGYFFGHSWRVIERWTGKIGLFVFFILLVVAGFGYAYRWMIKNQDRITGFFREIGLRIASHPGLNRFTARHPALVRFIEERLSPNRYLGLHLTIGLLITILFGWALGLIVKNIIEGTPLIAVDQWVLLNVASMRSPEVTTIMLAVTRTGSLWAIVTGSFIVSLILIIKKRFDSAATLFFAITGGVLLVHVLKTTIQRMRPMTETIPVSAGGWSFPSSHAMMAAIFWGMIAYLVVREYGSWRFKTLVISIAGFIVFLIGLSRIYLQVHYLSDVLGGYAGGLFWMTICITGLEVYRKSKLPGRL